MAEIFDINENDPHEVAELICLNCHKRAIWVYSADTLLKELECRNCGTVGLMIKTGQTLPDNDICNKCQLFDNKCKIHLEKPIDGYCAYFVEKH